MCLQHRALHPSEPLPQPNLITQALQSKRALEATCSSEFESMKKQFKLELNEKDKNTETGSLLWKVSDNGEPLSSITEGNENVSMQSIAKGVVTKVGTVDPVKDFRAMIAQNNVQEFGKVCSEMKMQINELLKQSFGKMINSKVIDCIRALREECCISNKPLIFNTFLEELKATLPIIHKGDFWREIQNADITLIANSECNSSSVTKDAALKFLQEQKDESDDNVIESPEEDENDLLNMM
ncbi:X-ray repair cross-complementing protein 5-like [Anneissia japonica]|uniref:X-ray repair cross-complementing protein 5-like n=1 Tax=Anneissia japonica TaxID=1529436 RepID=UPI001425537C|nr:X-ray repair cross-complementing protein 5-like [Anneissia japonica]